MRARGLLWIGLVASAGCHEQLTLQPPDVPGARGVVLGIEGTTGAEVLAFDIDEGWPDLALSGDPDLYAELFACPISRLGLLPGPLALLERAGGGDLPRPLGTAAKVTLEGPWNADGLPGPLTQDALQRLPLSDDIACEVGRAVLERIATTLPADGHEMPAFIVPLGSGHALVASREGFYYRVPPDGQVETLETLVEAPAAGHITEDGTLYVLDQSGRLHRGRLGGPFEVIAVDPAMAVGDAFTALSGPTRDDEPLELFLVTNETRFAVFDGVAWTVTATAPHGSLDVPHVVRLGPGRAAVARMGPEGGDLLLYEDGAQRRLPVGPRDAATGVVQIDGDTIVGTLQGNVLRLVGEDFERIPVRGISRYAHLIEPLPGGGLLVGGIDITEGFNFRFAQWLPDIGPCRAEQLTMPAAAMVAIDASTWVVLSVPSLASRQAFDLEILRLVEPPRACSAL